MRFASYLIAGVGLIALGAIGTMFYSHATPKVALDHPVQVESVEFIPDSRAGWAVEKPRTAIDARVHVEEARDEVAGIRESIPQVHDAVYYNTHMGGGHTTWAAVLGKSVGLLIFMALLVIAALVALRLKLNSEQRGTPAEGETIQALHRQAQSLAGRMEALETILLERSSHGR